MASIIGSNAATASSPAVLVEIMRRCEALEFQMSCAPETGALLRSLAAAKPGGRVLELGSGAGASTAWLLAGMDERSTLTTVEQDPRLAAVVEELFGQDPRVTRVMGDGDEFLRANSQQQYDLIFADTWPGKFHLLEITLGMLAPGGMYIIDDLLPQPTWPDGHASKVEALMQSLWQRQDLAVTRLDWSTGHVLATKLQ